jgi:hypothetical protein
MLGAQVFDLMAHRQRVRRPLTTFLTPQAAIKKYSNRNLSGEAGR